MFHAVVTPCRFGTGACRSNDHDTEVSSTLFYFLNELLEPDHGPNLVIMTTQTRTRAMKKMVDSGWAKGIPTRKSNAIATRIQRGLTQSQRGLTLSYRHLGRICYFSGSPLDKNDLMRIRIDTASSEP